MRRVTTVITTMLFVLAMMAGPAAAHSKDVNPPGQGDGHDATGVSRSWAQAHCHAQAPEQATASSDGVVVFTPDEALECGPTQNPGGQIHPHASG